MTHHQDVSTPTVPLPPTPPSPVISAETERVLAFVSAENQKHRDYFGVLFDRTTKVLGLIVLVAGSIAVYFGVNTVQGAKQVAEVQARSAANKQIDELKPEIYERISDEFQTPKITQIVKDEAQTATATTANHIIREEVQSRVSGSIAAEQSTIDRTLNSAAAKAVATVQGDIQNRADNAVQRIVANQFDPELRRLRAYTDATFLFEAARVGDGTAFDKVVAIATSVDTSPDLKSAANGTINAIRTEGERTLYNVQCLVLPNTVAPLISALERGTHQEEMEAIYCLTMSGMLLERKGIPLAESHKAMDDLFKIMTTAPDMDTRKYAYFAFMSMTNVHEFQGPHLRMFDNATDTAWWNAHRSEYIH